jgi:hypothetical protein
LNVELTNPLIAKDYEIDILIGKLAAILVIARGGLYLVWKATAERKFLFGAVSFILLIVIPCLYLLSLKTYNIKFAKLLFRSWFLCILLLCLSVTDKVLNEFSGFWRVIFPVAFITVCMFVGIMGVIRIKGPNQLKRDKRIKIPESHSNLLILIGSIDTIIGLISVFTLMVLIGKYFYDVVVINWKSLEQYRLLSFYIGMAMGYYPSKILGAIISGVFVGLVNLIYKNYNKLPS